jgi:hypothetical protein
MCNGNVNTYSPGTAVEYSTAESSAWRNLTGNRYLFLKMMARYKQSGWMQHFEDLRLDINKQNVKMLKNGDAFPTTCYNGCVHLKNSLVSRGLANATTGLITLPSCEALFIMENGDAPTGVSAGDDFDDAVLRLTFQ